MLGLSTEDKEKRREIYTPNNFIHAGMARAGSLSLIPTLYNTPMQAIRPEWTMGMEGYSSSGLDKTALSIPATQFIYNGLRGAGDVTGWAMDGFEGAPSQKELDRGRKLLTNMLPVTILVNSVGAQLLELEPE